MEKRLPIFIKCELVSTKEMEQARIGRGEVDVGVKCPHNHPGIAARFVQVFGGLNLH